MLKENAITTLNRCGLNVTQYYAVKEICYTFYMCKEKCHYFHNHLNHN